MNESETRAELIDPKLKKTGWGVVEGSNSSLKGMSAGYL
jgi:Holliday junction resolvasome RuvABC endonuclease subunit